MGKKSPSSKRVEKNHFIRVRTDQNGTRRSRCSMRIREMKPRRFSLKPDPSKPKLTTSAMIASIAAESQKTKAAPFGHALAKIARPDIVGLTADLAKYTDLHIFAQAHPDRFYQMGMADSC